MFDIVAEQEFRNEVFTQVYDDEDTDRTSADKTQRIALLCMVLALGALFDMNLPPCTSPGAYPDFNRLIDRASRYRQPSSCAVLLAGTTGFI